MQQFMIIFTHQNMVRVAPDFPPRERDNPILRGNRMNRMEETSKIEVDPDEGLEEEMGKKRNEQPHTHPPRFSMPWMEMSVFEGANLQWWLKKCERLFNWYNVPRG